MQRHYGLDWLRIGAFALLIFYHVGMFFVPWDWHVKTRSPDDWVAIPMLATAPWRLALLFVVSGYASATIIGKGRTPLGFVRERSARLLIPTLFAMAVIIPPQPWIELMFKHGYTQNYLHFWTQDYFRFGKLGGIDMPTWQHLWFVVYLWVYSLVLAVLAAVGVGQTQRIFDRIFGGIGLLLIPLVWALIVVWWLGRGVEITHNLVADPAHITYLPAFLFGVGLAKSDATLAAARRWWPVALTLAVAGYTAVALIEWQYPGDMVAPPVASAIYRTARAIHGWMTIVALLGLADRFLNHDHPWRKTLTEAVFPFYIIHQTVIVVVGWYLLPLALPQLAEFAILIAATVAGCWAFYLIGRRFGWLRPLIGLRRTA